MRVLHFPLCYLIRFACPASPYHQDDLAIPVLTSSRSYSEIRVFQNALLFGRCAWPSCLEFSSSLPNVRHLFPSLILQASMFLSSVLCMHGHLMFVASIAIMVYSVQFTRRTQSSMRSTLRYLVVTLPTLVTPILLLTLLCGAWPLSCMSSLMNSTCLRHFNHLIQDGLLSRVVPTWLPLLESLTWLLVVDLKQHDSSYESTSPASSTRMTVSAASIPSCAEEGRNRELLKQHNVGQHDLGCLPPRSRLILSFPH